MLQGRRFFEYRPPENFKARRKLILHKAFQYKYLQILVGSLALGLLAFVVPAIFFINQNYKIFTQMAFNMAPQIVDQLLKEENWIYFLFAVSCICLLSFFTYIVLRMTSKLVGPLMAVDRHMKKVIHGDFSMSGLKMRQDDELKDILKTYDHLYQSLRHQIQQDINTLKKLHIEPSDRESYTQWKNMISRKEKQIGNMESKVVSLENKTEQRQRAS